MKPLLALILGAAMLVGMAAANAQDAPRQGGGWYYDGEGRRITWYFDAAGNVIYDPATVPDHDDAPVPVVEKKAPAAASGPRPDYERAYHQIIEQMSKETLVPLGQ